MNARLSQLVVHEDFAVVKQGREIANILGPEVHVQYHMAWLYAGYVRIGTWHEQSQFSPLDEEGRERLARDRERLADALLLLDLAEDQARGLP